MLDMQTADASGATASVAAPETGNTEIVSRETSAPPETGNVSTETVEKSEDEVLAEVFAKMNKPPSDRDEQGRFKSTTPAEAAADEQATAEAVDGQEAIAEGSEPPAKPAAIDAPQSWSAEQKAKWASLPSDVQGYIAQREQDAHRQISTLGQQVSVAKPLVEAVTKHQQYLQTVSQHRNIPVPAILDQLIGISTFLDQDPASALLSIADLYKVDLAQFVPDSLSIDRDQTVSTYQRENANLKQQNMALQSQLQDFQRQQQEAQQRVTAQKEAEMSAAIDKFAQGKDDFQTLAPLMLGQIDAIRAIEPGLSPNDLLAKAYEAAAYAHPEIRSKRIAEQAKKAEAERRKAEAAAAEKAKKAASLNVKGADKPGQPISEDDLLKSVYQRMNAA